MEFGVASAATPTGTAGGNVSFGTMETGAEGSLSASLWSPVSFAVTVYVYSVPYCAVASMNSGVVVVPKSKG